VHLKARVSHAAERRAHQPCDKTNSRRVSGSWRKGHTHLRLFFLGDVVDVVLLPLSMRWGVCSCVAAPPVVLSPPPPGVTVCVLLAPAVRKSNVPPLNAESMLGVRPCPLRVDSAAARPDGDIGPLDASSISADRGHSKHSPSTCSRTPWRRSSSPACTDCLTYSGNHYLGQKPHAFTFTMRCA
jgi:hypothetical protein